MPRSSLRRGRSRSSGTSNGFWGLSPDSQVFEGALSKFGPSLFALGIHGRLVNCGNSSGDEATIPSLGYVFHSGITIKGSDPYRPEEFGPVWNTFCDGYASGDFEVVVDSEFALSEAAAAQNKMLSSDFFGKIVLRP